MADQNDPSGTYGANMNGVSRIIRLSVDSAGQLVNSTISRGGVAQPDVIAGTYDKSTARLAFSEFLRLPFAALFVPRYVGYGWADVGGVSGSANKFVFAGTYTEMVLVEKEIGRFLFEFVERGWFAM